MTDFLIYLFESGLCLSLFYMGYIVFFRKETYFTFNRFYLLGSMILALTVPLISLPFEIGNQGYLHETANGVRQIKDYYEHLILLTDPGALADPLAVPIEAQESEPQHLINQSVISISSILISLYILGVLFFTFRLFYLLIGLKKMLAKAQIQKSKEINLVLIKDEVPSFSFMKWIFVNPGILKPEELEQVLTHEKVHVEHKHSVDLLLAHIITIFQWFNPLTWRIQKSIKTCHEYIADRKVVEHGHALFDYQSLLLSQLISIRSVELVNNFNLLSIKKRIAMMNKHKSGKWAQLKAFAIVPILLAAFFFFTDMTSRSENLILNDSTIENSNEIIGTWITSTTGIDNIQYVKIKDDNLITITTKGNNNVIIKEYTLDVSKNQFVLTEDDNVKKVNYLLEDNKLFIDWGDKGKIEYTRNNGTNAYTLLGDSFQKLNLPYATQLNPYKKEMVLCTITLSGDKLNIDGKMVRFSELENFMVKLRDAADQSKVAKMVVLMNIDKDAKMEYVDLIKTALRNANTLKLGYLARLKGHTGTDYMALFNLLPPKDAILVDDVDLDKKGIALYEIEKEYKNFSSNLDYHVRNNKKYVMRYNYSNNTTYEDYIKTIDLVYKTINNLRNETAFFQGDKYAELSYEEQKKYRNMYPISLTMRNVDEE